ncbi:MAG: fibronectin type III domain-containing protein, partial [Gammaproteobacteria bacterium]|nr:fibronectin type III domain-containing protein [Gammaproteobacteria bacterium]
NVADDTSVDADADGLTLLEEYQNGTDPQLADTDADGLPDGYEVQYGLDPTVDDHSADLDGDGDSNWQEYENGTNPAQHAYDAENPEYDEPKPTQLEAIFNEASFQIEISWNDNSVGETGFMVQRRKGNEAWSTIDVTQANMVSFVDTNIQFNETYVYRVAAVNNGLQTLFTDPVYLSLSDADTQIVFIPRTNHSDGDYGIARYAKPVELDYVVPSGSNRLVIVGFSYEQNASSTLPKDNYTEDGQTIEDKTISQVYYGNVPLTRLKYVKTVAHEDGHNNHIEMWYMTESQLALTTGTHWDVNWFEEVDDTNNLRGFVATYANVDQANPIVDTQAVITTTELPEISLSLETISGGRLFAQTVTGNSATAQWYDDVTEEFDLTYSGVSASLGVASTLDGSKNLTVDLSGSTNRRALMAVSFRPAGNPLADTDADGLPDDWETAHGTDPNVADDTNADADADGLTLLEEYQNGTDPNLADSDADGLPDGYEVDNGLSPTNPADALADNDLDGVSNLDEYNAGTDPNHADVPASGNIDVAAAGEPFALIDFGTTASLSADSDGRLWFNYSSSDINNTAVVPNILGDATIISLQTSQAFSGASSSNGVTSGTRYSLNTVKQDYFWTGESGSEVGELSFSGFPAGETFTFVLYGSRQGSASDSRLTEYVLSGSTVESGSIQSINNEAEVVILATEADAQGTITLSVGPVLPDDRAHLNALEIILGNYAPVDTDDDGMPDTWELAYGYDPNDAADADLDLDLDGLTTLAEYNNSTSPSEADTDLDQMPDGFEVTFGLNPNDASDADSDADNDGVSNRDEYFNGTDPTAPDLDVLDRISVAAAGEPFALIDFGNALTSTTDDLGRTWTNYSGDSVGDSGALTNILGELTGVNLDTVSSFSGASTSNGVTSGTHYSLTTVKKDYLWTGLNGTEVGQIQLSDLPVGQTYTFVFYGSRVGTETDSRVTEFSVTGATIQSGNIQTINNADNVVILAVEPTVDGTILLQIQAVSPDSRAQLNAIEIILGHYAP